MQQFTAIVVLNDGFHDNAAERSHAHGQPCWNPAAVEREIRATGALH
jgi:hypothetical protein